MCPVRMTAVTGQTVVCIANPPSVFGIHNRAIMSVAGQTTKDGVVRGVRVADIAAGPLPCVRS